MKRIYLIIIMVLMFLPVNIKAEEMFTSKFSDEVNLEEEVDGSVILGGNNVTLTNITNGIGLLLGNNVNYAASSEYAFIFGNEVTFNGNFKDGAVFGNNINFTSETIIDRDIAIFGNNVILSGVFNRNVVIYASNVTLKDVTVNGSIKIESESLNIEKTSTINGILSVYEDLVSNIDGDAKIYQLVTIKNDNIEKEETFLEKTCNVLITLIRLFVVFALSLYLIPKLYTKLEKNKDVLKVSLKGLIGLVCIPLVSLILIFTSFGLPLGLILLVIYMILIYTSIIFSGYRLGNYIWFKYISKGKSNYLYGLLGITIIYLLSLIPYIGIVIKLLIIIYGLGFIISLLERKEK